MADRVDIIISQNLQRIAKMIDNELELLSPDERPAWNLFVWTKPEAVFVGNHTNRDGLAQSIMEIAAKIDAGNEIIPTHTIGEFGGSSRSIRNPQRAQAPHGQDHT